MCVQVGLNFDDVRMAVLVQRVVPAQYAFVIHTKNPSNNDETEVFCELVKGLGECAGQRRVTKRARGERHAAHQRCTHRIACINASRCGILTMRGCAWLTGCMRIWLQASLW